jgi:hypothetical protein
VLRRAPGEPRSGVDGKRGIGALEVGQRDPAAPSERQIADVAETTAEPEAERQRKPPENGDEGARG